MTTYPGFRDAVHVPYILVTCNETISPGTKCSLRNDQFCVKWYGGNPEEEPDWHGVADPFLEKDIQVGELFQLYIKKECFSGLVHHFIIETNDSGGTGTCHSVCNVS